MTPTRAAVLVSLLWCRDPSRPPTGPQTALEVVQAFVELQAPVRVLHASAPGLSVDTMSVGEFAFGRREQGPVQPVDWCTVPVVLLSLPAFDAEEYVIVDVDDGVPYEGFVRVLDAAAVQGARRFLLAGGPAPDDARACP